MGSKAADPRLAADRALVGPGGAPRRPRPDGGRGWWLTVTGVVVAAAFAAPFAYLLLRGAANPQAALSADILPPLGRSLGLAVTVSAAATVLGTACAWITARLDIPAARVWAVLLPLPLVIPSFIGALALIAAFAPGGLVADALAPLGIGPLPQVRGFWAAFVVLTVFTFPYVYLPTYARLRQLPPSLEESARLLGRSAGVTFWRVVLPQARGAVLAGTLLVFLYVVSDFGAVQLLRYDTLTRVIYATRVYAPTQALALSLVLALLAVLVVAGERVAARSFRSAPLARANRPLRLRAGRWRPLATAVVAATVGLSLVAPAGVLGYWAVRGLVNTSTRASALAGNLDSLLLPTVNTATVSVAAAVIAVVVTLPVAYLTARRRGVVPAAANAVVVAGFALPGLVIALALVFWALRTPGAVSGVVYQSRGLLLFAYVVHFGAQALRAGQASVAALSPRLDDAARILGAGRARRLLRIDLPLLLPGLAAGGGLVLLSTMKELPATLLLAPPGFSTLATKIWTAAEDAFFADASIAALLLIALSGLLTWWLVVRRSHALE